MFFKARRIGPNPASVHYSRMLSEERGRKIHKYIEDWLAKPLPNSGLNIDLIYDKGLIEELLKLKEQKNGDFKEEVEPQQE